MHAAASTGSSCARLSASASSTPPRSAAFRRLSSLSALLQATWSLPIRIPTSAATASQPLAGVVTNATEADRDAMIDSLKRAYLADQLSTDELALRVETAHVAETLDELDAALADLTAR